MTQVLLSCWFVLVAVAAPAAPEKTCVDARDLLRDLREAREELSELRGLSAAHPDYMTRREMVRRVDELRRLLDRVEDALDGARADAPAVAQEPPMAPDRFEALRKAMEGNNFDEAKLQVVREAASTNRFSVEQVKQVMGHFSFADGKVEAAKALHPRLVDPENFFQVYEELPFEADRKKLREAVAR
ncbi:MAG TPA: DUF4476 domain-containing protein [Myxococcota bacterium]|nr:DUF4476 domain-containing protein [Myxococcota bacterium]HRY95268.1 DUF4476 domain-containing protein [Myxococcota bacterium]HSA22433.1 DUF4476 domain-containing protein [Myxococcota bacterium]